ncbi:hypothetical protein V6N13_023244 [Hibiscus sabdariffa]
MLLSSRNSDMTDMELDGIGEGEFCQCWWNWVDEDRAMERLDGFRLLVAKAKFWRKVSQENNKRMNQEIPSKGKQEDE